MSFLSIELGKHRFKVLLLDKEHGAIVVRSDLTLTIPPTDDFKVLVTEKLREFIRRYDVTDRKIYLTIADPNIITLKNAIFPIMPHTDLVSAITWHAKEEGLLSEDSVLCNYEIVKEFTGDDETKKIAVTFSIVNKALLGDSIQMLSRLGLEPLFVSAAPLNTTKVLAAYGDSSSAQMVLDLGYGASTVAIYKNGKLLFLRTLSFSYAKVRSSLNDPLFLGAKYRTLEAENEIEQAVLSIGIPRDESAVGSGANRATQFYGLLRPLLEGLVREIRYSMTYYMTHLMEDAPVALFLTGHGSKFRDLDFFLARELGMTVMNLKLPAGIRCLEADGSDDPVHLAQCVSAVAGVLPSEHTVDFMPYELRLRRFEAYQRTVLKLVSVLAIGICVVAFVFENFHEVSLRDRLKIDEKYFQALGKFSHVSSEAFPKYFLSRELEKATLPPEKVLRLLGHLLPPALAIRHFEIDSATRSMVFDLETSGVDEKGNTMIEDLRRRMKETGFFRKLTVNPIMGYAVSVYRFSGEFRND